jgi:hypothetical protein
MGNGYVVPGLTWEHVTPESAGYSSARPGGPARLVKDAPYHLDDGGVCNSASFVWLQPDDEVLPIGFIPYCHGLHTFPNRKQAGGKLSLCLMREPISNTYRKFWKYYLLPFFRQCKLPFIYRGGMSITSIVFLAKL